MNFVCCCLLWTESIEIIKSGSLSNRVDLL